MQNRPQPDEALIPDVVAAAQHRGRIHIQRRVRLRRSQQLVDRRQRRRDGVRGTPRGLQEVQTHLSSLRLYQQCAWGKKKGGGGERERGTEP